MKGMDTADRVTVRSIVIMMQRLMVMVEVGQDADVGKQSNGEGGSAAGDHGEVVVVVYSILLK